jgi:hypothetical protein
MTMTRRQTTVRSLIVVAVGALIGTGLFATPRWLSFENGTDAEFGNIPAAATDGPIAAPVDEFVAFGRTPRERFGQTGPHYVATGLRTLAGALASLDIGGDELALDLRVASAHVLLEPTSLDNAALVRQLAMRTAQALPPNPAGAVVTSRALAITDERSLLQQQPAIHGFFAAVGDALVDQHSRTMSSAATTRATALNPPGPSGIEDDP